MRETIAHGAEAVLSHRQATTYILAVAVVIVALVLGWRAYAERQTTRGATALDDALKVFDGPTVAQGATTPQPAEPLYSSDQAKYTAALPKLEDVAKKYHRTGPGQLASYYAGLSLDRLGKENEAKQYLQSAASGGDSDYASLARFQVAQIDDKAGQTDEALKIYQQLMAKPTVLVPKPVVMFALARHYSKSNPTEASKLYAQIKSDYPHTSIADQADQELQLLPSKM